MTPQPGGPVAIPGKCPKGARYDPVRPRRDAWVGIYLEDAQEDLKILLGLMAKHDLHMKELTVAPEWAVSPQFTGEGFGRHSRPDPDEQASDRLRVIRMKIRALAEAEGILVKLPEATLIRHREAAPEWVGQDTGMSLWGSPALRKRSG